MNDRRLDQASIWSVEGNRQRLDAGSMFGNAPRGLWEPWVQPDDQHRIPLSTRAVVIREPDGRVVLLEAGVGAFFPPDKRERFGIEEESHVLLERLGDLAIRPEDVDVVVLSHLHFDHAGGALDAWRPDTAPALCFSRARWVVSRAAFERAQRPHPRDRASFIPELPELLEDSGRLELVQTPASEALGAGYRFHFSEGHTPGLMLTEIAAAAGPIVYASDLVPGVPWLRPAITMGYDRFPERVIDEKRPFLEALARVRGRIVFTHDASVACATVVLDEHGRFEAAETVSARQTARLQ